MTFDLYFPTKSEMNIVQRINLGCAKYIEMILINYSYLNPKIIFHI